ncbi:MAG: PQQ-dependent sugar dehydrogenase [Flavobacteriales bacterium]
MHRTNRGYNMADRVGTLLKRLLILLLFGAALQRPVSAQIAPFQHQLIDNTIHAPTSAAFLPDGRMLITSLSGQIFITGPVDQPPVVPELYMSLTNIHFADEHGLVEIVLDPDFSQNGWFYLYYGTAAQKNRVARFTHQGNTASLSSEFVVWESSVPYMDCCHGGGTLVIANDGTMLLAVGDDFRAQTAQDLAGPFGKVHRFNRDGTIPTNNPFYDTTPGIFNANGILKTIHSWGLRSPFRGTYDPPTGRLLLGEVGGNDINISWEDLHLGRPGANYGWPACGDSGRTALGMCADVQFDDPIHTYQHAGEGAAIIPGFVYHGSMFGGYAGKLFYSDYVRGYIHCLSFDGNGNVTGDQGFVDSLMFGGVKALSVVKLLEAPDGSVFYITLFDDYVNFTGSIHRIYTSQNLSPVCGAITATPPSGPGPTLNVQLAAAATDPEGQTLSYLWDPGDQTAPLPGASVGHVYGSEGMYLARVVVSDGNSSTACPSVQVMVGTPPTVEITSPLNGSYFHAGDAITFIASASDDDPLPPGNYTWTAVFNHDQHIHPDQTGGGSNTFDLILPSSGHGFSGNTWITVTVVVVDVDGLQSSATIEVFPEKVDVLMRTDPPGLQMFMDGLPLTAPVITDQAIGSQLTMSIPLGEQCLNYAGYSFTGWSDGGAFTHQYTVPAGGDTLTAHFAFNGGCGNCGQAMVFDGVNDLVSITPFTVVGDLTFEFWLKVDPGITDADAIMGNSTDFSLDLKNGRIHLYKVADRLTGSQTIVANEWHHYAITRAGNALKLFVDGVQDMAASATPFTGTMWVYALGDGLIPGKLGGALDEVRIWNHARTPGQLLTYKNVRIDPLSSGLSAYWTFDQDPTQQDVLDLSPNGHNGTRGANNSPGTDDPIVSGTSGPQQFACPRWATLDLRVLLQGPYEEATGLMKDALRTAGLVPLAEPYSALGYQRAGTSGESIAPAVLSLTGSNAIVDWVLVELRSSVAPSTILHTMAGLVQRDGDVVGLDGISPLECAVDLPAYYVAVRHRNHFGAMTVQPVSFGTDPVVLDMASTGLACYGTDARLNVSGVLLLWAGNSILDPDLKYVGTMNDRDPILSAIGGIVPTTVVSGYSMNDTNLDGYIKYTGAANDRDIILSNIGGTVPLAVRHQQLP